jgi:hypothetical protein
LQAQATETNEPLPPHQHRDLFAAFADSQGCNNHPTITAQLISTHLHSSRRTRHSASQQIWSPSELLVQPFNVWVQTCTRCGNVCGRGTCAAANAVCHELLRWSALEHVNTLTLSLLVKPSCRHLSPHDQGHERPYSVHSTDRLKQSLNGDWTSWECHCCLVDKTHP